MNSYSYRNSQLFLRNEFEKSGRFAFPFVHKQPLVEGNIDLIACSSVKKSDTPQNLAKGVHFFVDDYRFENTYHNPQVTLERYKNYKFLLAPQFSLYANMDNWRQIESIAKSRWVAAYWQSQGCIVYPSMCWSTPDSFGYCFDAIEKNSVVAVGMIGCKRNNYLPFMKGYDAMLERITPSAVIVLGKPFKEMQGNLIPIDYHYHRGEVQ